MFDSVLLDHYSWCDGANYVKIFLVGWSLNTTCWICLEAYCWMALLFIRRVRTKILLVGWYLKILLVGWYLNFELFRSVTMFYLFLLVGT